MTSRACEAVAPIYLFLCLLLGGSAQGIWTNMLLQLLGIALIAWAAAWRGEEALARPARRLFILVLLALGLIALQLVPLPPSLWASLGGRRDLAAGYALLGMPVPALPLSSMPHETLSSLFALIPPLAMLCVMLRLRAFRPSWLAVTLVAGTFCGILLGALQVASSDPLNSSWYLFRRTASASPSAFSRTPTTWRPCSSSRCHFSPRCLSRPAAATFNAIRPWSRSWPERPW